MSSRSLVSLALVLATAASCRPVRPAPKLSKRGGTVAGPVTSGNFPDPGLILPNGTGPWYSYATSNGHGWVPTATSDDFATWTGGDDALPDPGDWVGDGGIWAPDVRQIGANSFVMYYTAFSTSDGNHCIGAATSSTPAGPFTPQSAPIICDSDGGGVIDASGFEDVGGSLYVLWKVDGNSKGQSTPIYIQHLGADGFTLDGSATELITNDPVDGGVVEAPSMVYWDGWYYLFFSSNVYSTLNYDVSYAVSQSVTGPFTKVQAPDAPLLVTGDCSTAGPGGMTAINVLDKYVNAVFHSDINGENADGGRAMWTVSSMSLSNGVVTVDC